jgi:hypothetical protein
VFASDELKKIWVFEISDRKDDSVQLRKFLTKLYKDKSRLVGFNNLGFDYPVIHFFLQNKGVGYRAIYDFAMDLIETAKENRFANTIPEHKHFIKQMDLFKIQHYDNAAKATSLKLLEFNMRSNVIEDLPFDVGIVLDDKQKDVLLEYNKRDVLETLKFFKHCNGDIELREVLKGEWGMDFTNASDAKIGNDYFVKCLEEALPDACYTNVGGKRKPRQTKRDSINLGECIFPYVKFERPEFNAVLDWLRDKIITETKGTFSDIPEDELGDVAKYARLTEKKKKLKVSGEADKESAKELRKKLRELEKTECEDSEIEYLRDQICGKPIQSEVDKMFKLYPMGWVEREVLKSGKTSFYFKWRVAETLNVVIDGLEYVFGTGGIHASRESITYVADKNRMIMDIDVRSMYPNLFIANRVYPEHLSETFCEIYEILYEKRKEYPKKTPQNLAIKLALNSVYGRTNDKYSVFYDPKATMTITINGQLSLCMLTEMLMKEFDDIEFIQLNTDGITYVADRKDYDAIWSVIRQWEQITGLQMEDALYSKMAIRDVNNYCAVYEESGKIKLNGAYEHRIGHIDGEGLAFHQNQSMVVIKRAAVEQIVNGIPVDKTIRSCKNPFDFCGRTKVPRSSRLVSVDEEGIEYAEQNICRYYIAKDGRSLVKIMPPLDEGKDERYLSINAGQKVRTCNDIKDFSFKDLDYDFYIQEAQKMVDNVGVKVV